MKLYCFSYAGGSAMVYSKWKEMINKSIEIVPVELPGRGNRFSEELCDNMEDLIDDIYIKLEKQFIEEEYMLYGHSMGSWIVYYLTKRIEEKGIRLPKRLFLSGKEAPHITKNDIVHYKLNNKEFIEKIYDLGGTSRELLENKEILEIYIPILKNDYKVIETCKYKAHEKAFNFDITIFNGTKDTLTEEDINAWSKYTSKNFNTYNFDGGHFFIHDYAKQMLDIIYDQTKKYNKEQCLVMTN